MSETENSEIGLQDILDCFKDKLFLKLVTVKLITFISFHYFMFSFKRTGLRHLP